MLTPSAGSIIYLVKEPVDMRKGHDGLIGVTRDILRKDPLSGHFFVFFNRRRTLIKILVWEAGGFWIFYKKLAQGTIEIPKSPGGAKDYIEVTKWQLDLIFAGISVKEIKRRKRYNGYDMQRKTYC